MSLSIAVVCEARADRDTTAAITDKVILTHTWVDDGNIEYLRAYRGYRAEDSHLSWIGEVRSLADQHNVSAVGFFNGLPGLPDAQRARLALLLLLRSPTAPSAILLIRDSDGNPDRETGQGLRQAREIVQPLTAAPIIIGVAHAKRECWVLAGFEPEDHHEQERLDDLRKQLGYHPCDTSERLDAEGRKGVHNAKHVLTELTRDDPDRELRCLTDSSLATLRSRGLVQSQPAFCATGTGGLF